VLFKADNKHVEGCGSPPEIDANKAEFASYYENEHGEQWIAICQDGLLLVYGGDAGWENCRIVKIDARGIVGLPGIMISGPEQMWLQACWAAYRRQKAATK